MEDFITCTGIHRVKNEAMATKSSDKVHSHCSKLNSLHYRWSFRSFQVDHHCFGTFSRNSNETFLDLSKLNNTYLFAKEQLLSLKTFR